MTKLIPCERNNDGVVHLILFSSTAWIFQTICDGEKSMTNTKLCPEKTVNCPQCLAKVKK